MTNIGKPEKEIEIEPISTPEEAPKEPIPTTPTPSTPEPEKVPV